MELPIVEQASINILPAVYTPPLYVHYHLYPIVFPSYKQSDDIGHFYRINNERNDESESDEEHEPIEIKVLDPTDPLDSV